MSSSWSLIIICLEKSWPGQGPQVKEFGTVHSDDFALDDEIPWQHVHFIRLATFVPRTRKEIKCGKWQLNRGGELRCKDDVLWRVQLIWVIFKNCRARHRVFCSLAMFFPGPRVPSIIRGFHSGLPALARRIMAKFTRKVTYLLKD